MSGDEAAVRIETLVTKGTFSLDGGSWEVENNVWIIGNDLEVLVIDPAHDARAVVEAVAGREVRAVLLSHGHDDHIRAVGEFCASVSASAYLHPADQMLWRDVYPEGELPRELTDGEVFRIGAVELTVLHTPGHSPGSCCFYTSELGIVFSGDTLFRGGPGATGRSYSDYPTILASIRSKLLTLAPETEVRPGHGPATTVAAETDGINAA